MTGSALRSLIGADPVRPVDWIKIRRDAPYKRLVVPACEICGDKSEPIVWYRCRDAGAPGRARCLKCFTGTGA
jgi:hypothetical protein